MAAYMGPSFTCEAAQDRECGDRPSHPGGASSRIPRALNITPSSVTAPSEPKAIFRDGMSDRGTFQKCRNVRLESGMRTEADIVKRPLNGLFKEVKLNRGMP